MTKLIYHPLSVFIITAISIIFFISLHKSAQKTEISTENIKILEQEVHQISDKVIETEAEILKTETDDFKEKVIRNELLLQKSNERIIQLPDVEYQNNFSIKNLNKNKPIDEWLKLIRI